MTEDVQIDGGANEKLQSQLYIGKYAFLWLLPTCISEFLRTASPL